MCLAFINLWITFSTTVCVVCVRFVQCFEPHAVGTLHISVIIIMVCEATVYMILFFFFKLNAFVCVYVCCCLWHI